MNSSGKRDIQNLNVVDVDIGKDTFHLIGCDGDGNLVLRRKIKRLGLDQYFEKLPRCVVGIEACLSAHFVSRSLRKLGFEPRIILAIYVRPFIKGQKNDYNDAEAIAEAALRPNLPTVPEKNRKQLDLQMHLIEGATLLSGLGSFSDSTALAVERCLAGYRNVATAIYAGCLCRQPKSF